MYVIYDNFFRDSFRTCCKQLSFASYISVLSLEVNLCTVKANDRSVSLTDLLDLSVLKTQCQEEQ